MRLFYLFPLTTKVMGITAKAYRNGRGYKRILGMKMGGERSASGVNAPEQAAAGFARRLRDQSIISIKQLFKEEGVSLRMYFRRRLLAFD